MNPSAQLLTQAQVLKTSGDMLAALGATVEAIHADPRNPVAWHLRALVLVDLGELDQAALSCERALVLEPNHRPALATAQALGHCANGRNEINSTSVERASLLHQDPLETACPVAP